MDKDLLEDMLEQRLSTRDIAQQLKVSQSTVRYWIKKYELSTFRLQQGRIPEQDRYQCLCGEVDPSKFYGIKQHLCKACDNKRSVERNREARQRICDYMGGRCDVCGASHIAVLTVHHLDPSMKDPNFSNHRGWSWERIQRELKSCKLLCHNCHAIEHYNWRNE